jgi:hypothetical protein
LSVTVVVMYNVRTLYLVFAVCLIPAQCLIVTRFAVGVGSVAEPSSRAVGLDGTEGPTDVFKGLFEVSSTTY